MKHNSFRPLFVTSLLLLFLAAAVAAKDIEYKLVIDAADLTGVKVELLVPGANGTVRLAMAAHPEYDDKYYRYIEDFKAESMGRSLTVTKPESAIWQVDGALGLLNISYRVKPAQKEREWRQAWKPFLTQTGGMVGDLHMLMYVIGTESGSASLRLEMPNEWAAASGLAPASRPNAFTGTVEDILDAPVIVGKFDEWKFDAAGVPHRVVIWSPTDAKPADSKPIVDGIKRLAAESIKAFGRPPYPRYAFLLENGGSAALEHNTSLNMGISGETRDVLDDVAHEYIHVWNLMDVRPRERVGLRYKFAEPTGVLWWSEGATIMFSDLIMRRADIPGTTQSRIEHLESILARYYSSKGYSALSAELVSRADSHPELLQDNSPSTHLQGEVFTAMIDLTIRDRTAGRRDATDVMRLLAKRFDSRRGIGNRDIEKALGDVCGCDVRAFFRDYIYDATPVDVEHYLSLVGLRAEVKQIPAVDEQGRAVVDLRIAPVSAEGEFRARVLNSESIWAKAGVRTGDRVTAADGKPIAGWDDFRSWLRGLKIGDIARIVVKRDNLERTLDVPIRGFDRASVKISEMGKATPRQKSLRDAWAAAR
jgi:predicted metalloprotease with PDZ domain